MKKIIFTILAFIIAGNSFSQNLRVTDRLQKKLQFLNPLEYTGVLIVLTDQVDIESLDKELYRINAPLDYRAQTVINTLKQKAEQTQGSILAYLNSEKDRGKVSELLNFWVSNIVYAKATSDVIMNLSNRADIQIIDLDDPVTLIEPVNNELLPDNNSSESVETGLRVIKADKLWEMGFTGKGRTVMHIDTGVDGLHPALAPGWWGNNGRPWYHSWFDPVTPFTTLPSDCTNHGTHTMGTMCGRDSQTNDTIGVAPDAFWMAAGITDCMGASYPSMNIAAFQWAMDPDSNSSTMDMPDVINCSWKDITINGTQECSSIYVSTLSAVEAAGIAVIFAAGNEGPGVQTVTAPCNINTDSLNTFSVGAVNGNVSGYPIAAWSSRGPSICGGSGTLAIKPEVSAPGVNVRSSFPNNSYGLASGTSMASPHVAGAITLLKQAAPNLTGRQLKSYIFSSCTDLGDPGEDNSYGKGLINVYAALQNLGYFPINNFNIQTPPAGTTITTYQTSTTPVTITWDTSALGAQYKWIFGNAAAPRLLTVTSNTNSITMTSAQLDQLLTNAGVVQGSSIAGQWDVWSFRANSTDSLKATNGPRALTLTRGIPDLTSFDLVSPQNGATINTSAFNTSSIDINWRRSGKQVTYKWKFGSPSLANVKLSFTSDNSGFDTTLTLVNNIVNGMLEGLGLHPGDSLAGEWTVWAYNGFDSVKAAQNNSLTLKREGQSEILVLYDSTNANCRISKDSVVANLNSLSVTYQLYNRKGSQSTNSASFRGYNKIILLGEGNTVMSNAIKDSLKTYLNSGTLQQKAKLLIFAEDIGYQFDRSASQFYDSVFCRSICGFQYAADRPGPVGQRGLVGVSINNNLTDSSYGPSMDVLKRSSSVPLAQTSNLYRYRLFNDSMNAIGRISETYNIAVFAVDVESLRPAFDSPAGSTVKRLIKGGINFVDEIITSVNPSNVSVIPQEYSLAQNYPNPFNPVTVIRYSIPSDVSQMSDVKLVVYNNLGKEITTLVNEKQNAGNYEVGFDGSNFSSGIYFYRIEAGSFTETKSMVLIK